MIRTSDLLVVGGGIAGVTVAIAAADHGLSVHLIDIAKPGAASRASAGLLAPSLDGLPLASRSAAIDAREAYPSFLSALHERTGVDVALDRNGIIELANNRSEFELRAASAAKEVMLLDERELASLEPALEGHAGAFFHPLDGFVDNVSLMLALDRAVDESPRIERHHDLVTAVWLRADGASAVTAAGDRFECGVLVLAAGAWANGILGLPRSLPIRPVRGQLLRLSQQPASRVICCGGGYFVPRGGGLIVGATSEETGYLNQTTADGRSALRAAAIRTFAALSNAQVIDHWAGLRPVTPDGLPILGADPRHPSLAYACGLSRNGILFAPWAAGQLMDGIAGKPEPPSLSMFSVRRFAEITNQSSTS